MGETAAHLIKRATLMAACALTGVVLCESFSHPVPFAVGAAIVGGGAAFGLLSGWLEARRSGR